MLPSGWTAGKAIGHTVISMNSPHVPSGSATAPTSPNHRTSEHVLVELPYLPRAVPEARQAIRTLLGARGLPADTVDVAELLVSELVTNAVKYGDPPVWLLVELRPGLVHASVSDTSEALPHRREVTPASEGGRGLLVLDALAGSWGAAVAGAGKYLWFDLPVSR
jgi:anti-sigma regulatory factor (Ser/Thr protein kinase)